MAAAKQLVLLLLVVLLAAAAPALAGAGDSLQQLGMLARGGGGGVCRGTVGECGGEDGEDVDAEELGSADAAAHRRVLYGREYISYGALRRDTVPCSRRGASYYNCRPGASANPYHRGCSRIARCRG